MTTPSIDMSLVSETPAVGLAPVLTGTGTVQMDLVPQPSSESVARFQAAMAEPLSENDQKCPVFAKTVPEISLPPSVARISVLDAGEVVREVIAGDQSPEAAEVAVGGRGKDVVQRGAVIPECVKPGESVVAPVRTVTPGLVQSIAEPVQAETAGTTHVPVRAETTGTTHVPVRAETAGTTADLVRPEATAAKVEPSGMKAVVAPGESVADQPDAERLVAAGVVPMVAGEQKTPEVIQVKDIESVAPIAALSPRDRVVRLDVLVEAATAVADTLLVSPGLIRGEGEILVQLKPDVIEGSQIRISVQGKTLDVAFLTPTEQLTQMLTTRLPELQQHLVAALPAFSFKVSVGVKAGWTRETERKGSV